MKIRATLRIRNDEMIAAREKLGLSQIAVSKAANVPIDFVFNCERLNYAAAQKPRKEEYLERLSAFLGIPGDVIMPEELASESIQSTFTAKVDVDNKALLEGIQSFQSRNLLPSPDEEYEHTEILEIVQELLPTLSYREREVIKLLYGLDTKDGKEYTHEEVAKMLCLTRSRIYGAETDALRKLRIYYEKRKKKIEHTEILKS